MSLHSLGMSLQAGRDSGSQEEHTLTQFLIDGQWISAWLLSMMESRPLHEVTCCTVGQLLTLVGKAQNVKLLYTRLYPQQRGELAWTQVWLISPLPLPSLSLDMYKGWVTTGSGSSWWVSWIRWDQNASKVSSEPSSRMLFESLFSDICQEVLYYNLEVFYFLHSLRILCTNNMQKWWCAFVMRCNVKKKGKYARLTLS